MSSILVVDDEALITMQLDERLRVMGYTIAGLAANGEEGITKARSLRPDLVLMDIVMPGKMNGIEAAKSITDDLDIPVIFLTSYADDTIIEKAKNIRPYGYIIKPFNERELRAAIEVALYRKSVERNDVAKRNATTKGQLHLLSAGETEEPGVYLDIPQIRIILLRDIFSGIILFLYTDPSVKESVLRFAIEESLKSDDIRLFSYSSSSVRKFFLKEIQNEQLLTCRMAPHEAQSLKEVLGKCFDSSTSGPNEKPLRLFLDFADTVPTADILAIKQLILDQRGKNRAVTGLITVNITNISHGVITSLAEGIPRVMVSTGHDTALSFAHDSFPAESVSVVPQETIDEVIKKSLEPVILALLTRPVSGHDIVHEIHTRYNVLIPQARVYSFLFTLSKKGYLDIRMSGKSKMYCPTEKGKIYISQRLEQYRQIFRHVMGDRTNGIPSPAIFEQK